MSTKALSRRRWRPRWLTSQVIAIGSVFTVVIFAFALGVAILVAGLLPAGAGSQPGSTTRVVSPSPVVTEPND